MAANPYRSVFDEMPWVVRFPGGSYYRYMRPPFLRRLKDWFRGVRYEPNLRYIEARCPDGICARAHGSFCRCRQKTAQLLTENHED